LQNQFCTDVARAVLIHLGILEFAVCESRLKWFPELIATARPYQALACVRKSKHAPSGWQLQDAVAAATAVSGPSLVEMSTKILFRHPQAPPLFVLNLDDVASMRNEKVTIPTMLNEVSVHAGRNLFTHFS
jgi:hypothetical protein